MLIRVAWTDWHVRTIGKKETCLLAVLGIISNHAGMDALAGGVICAAIPEMVNLFVCGLTGLGGGDIRLMFAAGCLLGTSGGLLALLLGGSLALLYAGFSYKLRQTDFLKMKLPYGPFLSLGIALIFTVDFVIGSVGAIL